MLPRVILLRPRGVRALSSSPASTAAPAGSPVTLASEAAKATALGLVLGLVWLVGVTLPQAAVLDRFNAKIVKSKSGQ